MHLRKGKLKDGDLHISITHCYRGKDGKNTTKTYKTYGRLSQLTDKWKVSKEEALLRCEEECKQLTKQYNDQNKKTTIEISFNQRADMKNACIKNLGSAVICGFYNMLGIEIVVRNTLRKRKVAFDVNSVLRLLSVERILNPSSKLSAYENKDKYFFKSDFSLKNLYTSLDILCDMKDKIISSINREIKKWGYRNNTDKIFYDVTNYYFECEQTEIVRNGCSKENKPNPIIQMGLLQDNNAIPITFNLFPGNTTDCKTLLPCLQNLKEQENLSRVVVVADKGNNTSTNIVACVANGDGFVFSQSIRGTKSNAKLRDWVIDEKGYTYKGDKFKIKSKQDTKNVTLKAKDTYDGRNRSEKVDVKIVAFWSEKYEKKARRDRQKTIEKAREMIARPSKYVSACNYGASKYVKNLDYKKDTGEVIDTGKKLYFDEERLQAEEKCDGYYCIITSETDMSDEEIIETYRGLWQIEESFKITKSDLKTRPVYVRTDRHIEAHFLICYIALTISRLIQNTLSERVSVKSIADTLSKSNGYYAEKNIWHFEHRDELLDDLYEIVGMGKQKKWMTLENIKKCFGKKILPGAKKV